MHRRTPSNAEDPLLTLTEVMFVLGCSRDALTRRIKGGEIPYVKPLEDRRKKLVRQSDLDAYIERATQPKVGAA